MAAARMRKDVKRRVLGKSMRDLRSAVGKPTKKVRKVEERKGGMGIRM